MKTLKLDVQMVLDIVQALEIRRHQSMDKANKFLNQGQLDIAAHFQNAARIAQAALTEIERQTGVKL